MGEAIIPATQIAQAIQLFRARKVKLVFDLAALYEVTTGALNQAVRRNRSRFSADFMFRLNPDEETL